MRPRQSGRGGAPARRILSPAPRKYPGAFGRVRLKGANNTIVSSFELPIRSRRSSLGHLGSVFARRAGGDPLISLAYLICRSQFRLLVRAMVRIDDNDVEIVVLRHQLEVRHRQNGRPRFRTQDRMLLAALSRLLPRWRWRSFLVKPDTLMRWHRQLVTAKARRWGRTSRGRPPTAPELKSLVIRLARENPRWGYMRIRGELLKLGHDLPVTTLRDILRRAGLGPTPRQDGPGWTEFLRAQAATILARDFFTTYTLWGRVVYVLFFIELSTRRVHLAGCTSNPDWAWVVQQARNLCLSLDRRTEPVRFLIHDRDSKFSGAFDEVFSTEGIEIKTPIRSPPSQRDRRALDQDRASRMSRLAADRGRAPPPDGAAHLHRSLQPAEAASRAGPEGFRDRTVEVTRDIAFFEGPPPGSSRRSHP